MIKVNPRTGKQTILSSNDQAVNQGTSEFFNDPWSLIVTPSGQLLVSDNGGVIGVNPKTGKQSIVSSISQPINSASQYLGFATGIVRLPSGALAVSSSGPVNGVIGVDPATGKQKVISENAQPVNAGSSEFYSSPYGLGTDGRGSLMVADADAFGGDGGIIGVDPASGKERTISSNTQPVNASSQLFTTPSDLELYRGTLYVSDGTPSAPGSE